MSLLYRKHAVLLLMKNSSGVNIFETVVTEVFTISHCCELEDLGNDLQKNMMPPLERQKHCIFLFYRSCLISGGV